MAGGVEAVVEKAEDGLFQRRAHEWRKVESDSGQRARGVCALLDNVCEVVALADGRRGVAEAEGGAAALDEMRWITEQIKHMQTC